MLKNYFKIVWRNLIKNKALSFLNISGLAIGMASALMIMLWIQNEVSYDQLHKNKEYIYEAWNRGKIDGKLHCWNSTPNILAPTLKKDFPEIADAVRTVGGSFVTTVGDRKFSSGYMIVDPGFLTMFSFPLKEGNPETSLNSPVWGLNSMGVWELNYLIC